MSLMLGLMSGAIALLLAAAPTSASSAQDVTASDGWVQLPRDGENAASAFVIVNNPTMYDVYVVSAASDVAGKVELRRAVDGETKTVKELTVPAYGKLSMRAGGVHLRLVDLKRPLEEDETITLALTTDTNVKLRVKARVRKE